jgi:DNA-directed RNA polymerase subunit RPC12/RpoP
VIAVWCIIGIVILAACLLVVIFAGRKRPQLRPRRPNGAWRVVYSCVSCGHEAKNIGEMVEKCPDCDCEGFVGERVFKRERRRGASGRWEYR